MDVAHLKQEQLAIRWHLSEACLERWRSEGVVPGDIDQDRRGSGLCWLRNVPFRR